MLLLVGPEVWNSLNRQAKMLNFPEPCPDGSLAGRRHRRTWSLFKEKRNSESSTLGAHLAEGHLIFGKRALAGQHRRPLRRTVLSPASRICAASATTTSVWRNSTNSMCVLRRRGTPTLHCKALPKSLRTSAFVDSLLLLEPRQHDVSFTR
jgi:hypothetical protein